VLCGARATAGRCTLSLGWRATWKRVNPFLTGPVITSCIRHSFRMERQARHPITAAVTSSSAQRSEPHGTPSEASDHSSGDELVRSAIGASPRLSLVSQPKASYVGAPHLPRVGKREAHDQVLMCTECQEYPSLAESCLGAWASVSSELQLSTHPRGLPFNAQIASEGALAE
jgi:hypothetical protein